MRVESRQFSPLQRLLHWLTAVCVLAMLFVGVAMVSTLSPRHLALLAVHRPLGILILLLTVIRLVPRIRHGAPPLPRDLPPLQIRAAKLSHLAFYGFLFAVPLIGWAMLSAGGYPVLLFGSVHLPPMVPRNDSLYAALHQAHVTLAFLFFALILIHLGAALYHWLIRRDDVFRSMSPFSKS